VDYADKMKISLQQVLVYSLVIIVNNFQIPKIQAVLSSYFHDGNDIACGSNRGGGWGVGSI